MSTIRHITLPAGFVAAAVRCGIKTSGEDLAVIAGEREVSAAVMTTSNQVVGAPVLWCRKILHQGFGRVRGVVINSGCSNVCTGKAGLEDAEAMAGETARLLGAEPSEILVASTGIIGQPLPMGKIRKGIAMAVGSLGWRNDPAVVRAIMTTDTVEKSAVVRTRIAGQPITRKPAARLRRIGSRRIWR